MVKGRYTKRGAMVKARYNHVLQFDCLGVTVRPTVWEFGRGFRLGSGLGLGLGLGPGLG